jgi:hypothetical protein
MALKTDPLTGGWTLQGDAHHVLLSEERQQIIELIRHAGQPLSCRVMAIELEKTVEAIRKCVQRMVSRGHLVMTERGLYDVPPVTNTPVPGVPSVLRVLGVPGVLGESGQDSDWGGQEGCPSLTLNNHRENLRVGQVGQGRQPFTQGPVHDNDQDTAGVFGEDSGAYVRRHPDAPPKVLDGDVTLEMAAAPKPPVPPFDDRYADARGEQVDRTEEEMF